MNYKFWSRYEGLIKTNLNLNKIKKISPTNENKLLIQALVSCLSNNEIPLFNNKPLVNYRKIKLYPLNEL